MNEHKQRLPSAAANGLLDRREFLQGGALAGAVLLNAQPAAARPSESLRPGAALGGDGAPSKYEAHIRRVGIAPRPGTTGSGATRTPLEFLEGIITPSRVHFERSHSGIPEIDPQRHTLMIHGLVRRPLKFNLESLQRYPMVSRIQFLECSGNSAPALASTPSKGSCGEIHGLVSCSEWSGVPLRMLLEEAGIEKQARWIVAEGADAALMSRSIPLEKIRDDAIVALYQNGERLRPPNGYPMRLFLPGWEGNMNVKWLHRIKVTAEPAMTKDETSKYSDRQPDGRSLLFTFPMGVKSVITSPSPGLRLGKPGVYQISGLAWSGEGKIRGVEVSADGGKSWARAALEGHILPKCLTRFRAAWRWDGAPGVLLSRAVDEKGRVQPTRASVLAARGIGMTYHNNGIQAWHVKENGEVENVNV